ncbi:MAG: IS21 family transposase [Bacteroidales bacterium]
MTNKQEIIIRYYRHGDSERKISRELDIHRDTVRRYLKEYRKARKNSLSGLSADELIEDVVKKPQYNSYNRGKRKLTPELTSEIDKLLKLNEVKKSKGEHKQLLKKIDILEHLNEKGFNIGYTSVCNYISEKSSKIKEAYIRQVYEPGDVCEFDWGEVKLVLEDQNKKVNMAVFTSARSNYRYAMLFYRQDTTSFQQAHVNFFDYVGGVYKTMVYDNMRVALRRFVGSSEKEPTDALLKLSLYYHFDLRFCNIRRGNEKGHVERSVEYIRRKAFSRQDSFSSLEEANKWLLAACDRLNASYSGSPKKESPLDLFNQEKTFLYPAAARFDCAIIDQARVDKYSTIACYTNRYSIPDHLVGEMVDIKIYPEKLICYHHNERICVHERRYGRHGWHIVLDHYLGTLHYKPGALGGSKALQSAPENVKSVYENYFRKAPRDFVELLLFARDYKFNFTDIEKAIDRLRDICPGDISLDKIKAVSMQKAEAPIQVRDDRDDPILHQANSQLREYNNLLN